MVVFHLGSVSFVFCWLLCLLPLPGIKLRGSCLYFRGFSNYMFNLFSRSAPFPPLFTSLAPGIFRRGESQGRDERFHREDSAAYRRRPGFSHPPLVKGIRGLY